MNHANFFPFERNRYFYGKLLTVRDFEVEQRYHCSKRALLQPAAPRLRRGVRPGGDGQRRVHPDD